jgi:hypothetical protein
MIYTIEDIKEIIKAPNYYNYYGNMPDFGTRSGIVWSWWESNDVLDRSNFEFVVKALREAGLIEDRDFEVGSARHWAGGVTGEQLVVVMLTEDDELTKAGQIIVDLMEQTHEYPVLDEDDYYERQREEGIELVGSMLGELDDDEIGKVLYAYDAWDEYGGWSSVDDIDTYTLCKVAFMLYPNKLADNWDVQYNLTPRGLDWDDIEWGVEWYAEAQECREYVGIA